MCGKYKKISKVRDNAELDDNSIKTITEELQNEIVNKYQSWKAVA
jgi:hypothetical protein